MENLTLFSPKTPHFFQPLLSDFQSHLKIPMKFFSEQIEGKYEGKTVNLRSDSSERTWEVEMEGHRLTNGWKEFVEAHDLRIGDIVVFRHEGDMLFHVTALGPSCCEIQYAPSLCHEEDEEIDEIEISSRFEKEVEENLITKSNQSSFDLNCFSQSVTASNLSRDSVRVPTDFAKRNGLNKGRQEIVLMNEEGRSWASELTTWQSCPVFIVRGWTRFCTQNKLDVGDSCTFRLLQNTETPVFRLCRRTNVELKKKIQSEEDNVVDTPERNRFLKLTPSTNTLELGKQHLPVRFTRVNMLNKPGKIILVDKGKVEWPMKLKADQSSRSMYIFSGKGWKSFCAANEVVAGESLTLELFQGGTSPLLKFCSKMDQPFEAEGQAHKRARVQKSKHGVRQKIAEEEGPSNKSTSDLGKLQHTQFCSISDHVAKVKESFLDTLTSIRRFQAELDTMERKLED